MRRWFTPLLNTEGAGSAGAAGSDAGSPAAGNPAGSSPASSAGAPAGAKGAAAPAAGKVAAAAKAAGAEPGAAKTYKVKVDGQEVTMSEQELLQYASLGKAGHKRMSEAAEARRQAEAFIENVRKDPMKALLDPKLGLTKEQVKAELEKWYKAEVIDEEALSPEQKKLRDAERRLKDYEEKEAKDKETKEAEQRSAIEKHWEGTYQKQIMETLDASGLPKTEWTVGRFAFYMAEEIRNTPKGQKAELSMELIADKVREDHQTHLRAFTQNASAEALLKFLGPEIAKKIRQHDLETLLKRRGEPAPATPAEEPAKEKPARGKKDSWTSIRRSLGR